MQIGAVLGVAAQIGDGIDITGPAGGIYQLHHDDSSFPPGMARGNHGTIFHMVGTIGDRKPGASVLE